ncbi:MAG: TonB-dependent receptor [Deltaproteobacteria bacterium]|nr:TonB-dependent receptor [Deltaproteobacteria bacterium]
MQRPAVAIPAGENLLLLIARAYGFSGTRAQRLAQATDLVLFQGEPGLGIPAILGEVAPNAQIGVAAQPIPDDPLQVRSSAWRRHRTSLRVYGIDGAASWDFSAGALGELRLDALFGWEHGRFNQSVDADGSELPLIDVFRPHRNDLASGELRLSSQGDGAVDWIAGLFYFRSETERSFDEIVLPFGTIVSELSGVAVGFAPFTSVTVRPLELSGSEPRIDLELFGGWRWNRDSQRLDFENLASPAGPSGPQTGRAVFKEHTWELGVRWFPSEDHTVYAKFARGYKSGNLEADNQTGVIRDVDPELIRAWELGLKSSLADGRVQLALTGFWSEYTDLQVPQTVGLTQFTQNAAAATIRGIELELVARPVEALTLQASAGFLDARFDEFCSDDAAQVLPVSDPGCPAPDPLFPWRGESNLAGHRLEDAPKWKASLFASYQVELGARGTLTPVVKLAYTSDYFLRPYALASDRVDAFTRTDVRLVWRSASERLTLEVFAENLENEIVYARNTTTGEFSGSFPASIGLLPPRTYGVRVGFAWRNE